MSGRGHVGTEAGQGDGREGGGGWESEGEGRRGKERARQAGDAGEAGEAKRAARQGDRRASTCAQSPY